MGKLFNFIISITIAASTFVNINKFYNLDIYNTIMDESCIVIESGVQGKYLSQSSIEEEIKKIETLFKIEGKIKKYNNNFYFNSKGDTTELNIFAIEEKRGINVEITIKEVGKNNNIDVLENCLKKANKNIKISSYLKGKVNNNFGVNKNVQILEDKLLNLNPNNIESINIDSGITGVVEFNNGEKINYAVVNYNDSKDVYMIIGTPVIFITY
ncbi:hypothetical protein [Clostridium massiliamazoniense]|uniref:hypothetical protein n=1 Tax=Clostridium massiliamazoniense TaxID=1347366 RepID=UPI0006D85277|nr:hypothetical protein [Clostridium massiliamazoniense]